MAEPLTAPATSSATIPYQVSDSDRFADQGRSLAIEAALDAAEITVKSPDYTTDTQIGTENEPPIMLNDEGQERPPAPAAGLKAINEAPAKAEEPADTFDLPGWLKRTSVGTVVQSGQDAQAYLETVQPLYQTPDELNTLFTQGRASVTGSEGNYSAGFGFRHLFPDQSLLAGINSFVDYKSDNEHYRTGLGLEAITPTFEFRTNSYFGLSPDRLIQDLGSTKIWERAASGFDMELGGPLFTHAPGEEPSKAMRFLEDSLKVYGGFYWYDFHQGPNVAGWKVRGEFKPLQAVSLNLSVLGDDNDDPLYQLDLRVHLRLDDFRPKSFLSALRLAGDAFAVDNSLQNHMLDRVERNFDVKVERWTENIVNTTPAPVITHVGNIDDVQLVAVFPGFNGADFNSNGFVDPGDLFELDLVVGNGGAFSSTGISYNNAVATSPGNIWSNVSAILPDAPPGGSSSTDRGSDLDITVAGSASIGDTFFITLDLTADGDTQSLTFGPFRVGAIFNGKTFSPN